MSADVKPPRRRAHRGPLSRTGLLATAAIVGAAPAVVAVVGADIAPAAADWSNDNCSGTAGATGAYSRAAARYYSGYYRYEGYHWDGGCYKLNDVDDSPYETPATFSPRGEGNDCSGFVDRIWGLKNYTNSDYSNAATNPAVWHNLHWTGDFISTSGSAWGATASKDYKDTDIMDAFVFHNWSTNAGHIGMIYDEGSGGADWIIEAKSEAGGTNLNYQSYRSQSAYQARYRYKWGA